MIRLFLITLLLVLPLSFPTPSHANALEKELRESMKYLKEIPEIKWVKVKKNSVIVGWKGLPSQFNLINTEAALKGTQATGRTVYIWSVRHTQKKWITGTRPYLCKTTASRGKVQETTCNL
ncbi:MAG: hypothetical protein NPINA01_22750 [Nitrospinaceae bacterium]|nr:MAG: hypothetical protein NPINA01_22750 [Nitrospinaceae bacterium]